MAQRRNRYDAAFEELLRDRKLPYVAVDESRRALMEQTSLKSMDYLVYAPGGEKNLLVDVKGRRFPVAGSRGGSSWENWTTREDISSLLTWQRVFGDSVRALFVYAYEVGSAIWSQEFPRLYPYRGLSYAYFGVWVDEYQWDMKTRSEKWGTVFLSQAAFRRLRFPISRIWDSHTDAPLAALSQPA